MSDDARHTFHVDSAVPPAELQDISARCGEISSVYPRGPVEEPSRTECYIERLDQEGVNRARGLALPGTSINTLDVSPELVDRFHAPIIPGRYLHLNPDSVVLEPNARWTPYPRQKFLSRRKTRAAKDRHSRPCTYTILNPATPMNGSSFSSVDYYPAQHYGAYTPDIHAAHRQHFGWADAATVALDNHLMLPSGAAYMRTDSHPASTPRSSFSESAPSTSNSVSKSFTGPHQTLNEPDTTLYLTDGGEILPINLQTLEDAPDDIIATLRVSARHPVDCGKWIMVGATYRGRGNLQAAIAVITAMIEVMSSAGMESSQLKPAVLMLSSCHLEVARQLRSQTGTDTEQSRHHLNQACDGFRRVYGAFELPADLRQRQRASSSSSSHARGPTPTAPARAAGPSTAPVGTGGALLPSSPRFGQAKLLERELQTLRERQQTQIEALARAGAAKRKLEDELAREQQRRRRAEDALAGAERDAADVRRAESRAREQVRAEGEGRRRAEDRADELRERVAELELRIAEGEDKERRTREYFGKLGLTFLKAARGDMGDIPSAVRM